MHRFRVTLVIVVLCLPRGARSQGNPLGPEFRVNTYTTGSQGGQSIATDSSGNFVVVWASAPQDGSQLGIFGQRYASSGVPLDVEFRVNSFTTDDQWHQSVASEASGNFVVVWESYGQDSQSYGVFGQRYASSGASLGTEFPVNTYTTGHQTYPAVAAVPGGGFIVVWDSDGQDGSFSGVFGQRYASNGAPLGPEFRINTYTTSSQGRPKIAAHASGFIVVWGSDDGSIIGIFGQRYDATGAPLGPEFRVNTYTTSYQTSASVAADLSGNFVVAWSSYGQDGSSNGVFGRRFASSGAPMGPEFRVNTYTPGFQHDPAVALDAAGDFVVVWSSNNQDGSNYGVFGQRYASSGAPLGPEFRVNTYTPDEQGHSAVSSAPAGNFVVGWTSRLQDDPVGSGVFGQRYAPIVPVELLGFQVE